jgi:hypothetical protein
MKKIEKEFRISMDTKIAKMMLRIAGFDVVNMSEDEMLYKAMDLLIPYGIDWEEII